MKEQKFIQKDNYLIYTSMDVYGRKAWYKLDIEKKKLPLFKKAIETPQILNLEDYGKIIDSGFGDYK